MEWAAAIFALLLFQAAGNPVDDGLKALDEERYSDAAQAFEEALEADPENYGAQFNLAFAYTMLGRTPEAIAGYEKTLELKPGLYQAELNIGVLLLNEKEAVRALPHLKAAAGQKPEEFRPNFFLAEALYAAGDDPAAERCYRKAAELDPAAADAQVGIGRTVFNQGRFEEAEPFYKRAVAIDPGYADILLELAARYEEQGKSGKAIEIYQQCPDDPALPERLGNLLFQAGRIEEALPLLQTAAGRSPTVANRFALAAAYVKLKQPDKAVPLLELAIQEEPENYDLLMMHGRLLRDQRQFGLAAQDFFRAVQVKPDSQIGWTELAGSLILMEDYRQGLAALDRAEALGNAPPGIHFARAIVLDKAKLYEPALASYEKFLSLSQDQHPDQEFQARQRIKVIKRELRQ